jgi:hypothetical protein
MFHCHINMHFPHLQDRGREYTLLSSDVMKPLHRTRIYKPTDDDDGDGDVG